jgi:hypothetical protein
VGNYTTARALFKRGVEAEPRSVALLKVCSDLWLESRISGFREYMRQQDFRVERVGEQKVG